MSPDEASAVRASLPSNPEAARLYSEGLEKLRLFDNLAARDLLEQAIAAFPDFALSHSALAAALSDLGYDQKAKEEAKKAVHLASKLPKETLLSIEGRYREMTEDWQKAIETYQLLSSDHPDELDYGLRLANAETSAGRGKDALLTIEALRTIPSPARDDGRLDLAESEAARAASG